MHRALVIGSSGVWLVIDDLIFLFYLFHVLKKEST